MIENIKTLAIGGGGVTTSALVANIDFAEVTNLIVQLVIGIVTLWGLLRKNKKGGDNG